MSRTGCAKPALERANFGVISDEQWPGGIDVNDEPVRRLHIRSRRRNTSLVYSTYPLGLREAESAPEVRFLKVAQLDPGMSCIRSQPCWLRIVKDNRMQRYAPDFAVMYRGSAEIHEVRYDRDCWDANARAELLAARQEVERHPRWQYSVSLESALIAEPLQSNTNLLWRHFRPEMEIDRDLRLRTGEVLDAGQIRAADLIERTRLTGDHRGLSGSWDHVLAMIASGYIDFDVDEFLTLDSLVWNCRSGPPRKRTLPFGAVEKAIVPSVRETRSTPFCGLVIRRKPS